MKKNLSIIPYQQPPYHTGTAIPVFSLKSHQDFGIGQFSDIILLADFCHQAGLDIIQLLPINDTTTSKTWRDSSPYTAISVFALHPIYLNLEPLLDDLDRKSRYDYFQDKQALNNLEEIDYQAVILGKLKYARIAFDNVKLSLPSHSDFQNFIDKRKKWLPAYAAFNYLMDRFPSKDYSEWSGYETFSDTLFQKLLENKKTKDFIYFQYYLQYQLHLQLLEASTYCRQLGITLKGDIAIGVGRYSVDTWANPDIFNLHMSAGAPPDAFSLTGQNWGLPTYNWSLIEKTEYQWWKERLENMAYYFDAFRLDHILGFFRIWEIAETSVRGLLGHFAPAKGYTVEEIESYGIPFNEWGGESRFTQPFIKDWVIDRIFGRDDRDMIIQNYLNYIGFENYEIKPEFCDQRVIRELDIDETIRQGLYQLSENVIFIKDHANPTIYHPRIGLTDTISFGEFGYEFRQTLAWMHEDYFFKRNNNFWKEKALEKLPPLINATSMLACGEDLGMVPSTVPQVMDKLNILSLAVELMPSNPSDFVHNLKKLHYLCVATSSTHDTSTLRQWWEENVATTQRYFNTILHMEGLAPHHADKTIIKQILENHFDSKAMIVIIPIQDLFALTDETTNAKISDERINDPSNPHNNWNYRMHISLEELHQSNRLISEIQDLISNSRRSSTQLSVTKS